MDYIDSNAMEELNVAMRQIYITNNNALCGVDGDVHTGEYTANTTCNMASESARLASYRTWPPQAPLTPQALARAGFFFIGKRDIVECFCCHGKIENWEFGDSAMGEHKRLFANCLFVLGKDGTNQPLLSRKSQPSTKEKILLSPNQMESGSDTAQEQLVTALENELQVKDSTQKFHMESERLKSFNNFPQNSPMKPEELARAGFYYLGYADTVQCFICNGMLNNWRDGDIAMVEHRDHFPMCHFILGVDVGNVPLRNNSEERCLKSPVPVSEGIDPNIAHPQYATFKRRLDSFNTWSSKMNQKPDDLADAGFYYTGIKDNVKCFSCDGGLRNWEPLDEPWKEHAKWFPRCAYLLEKRGKAFVDFINTGDHHYVYVPTEQKPGDTCEVPPGASWIKNRDKLLAELDDLKDQKSCKICMDRDVCMLFQPCGHLVTCEVCSPALKKCPICRTPIRTAIRALMV
uniref:Baculoviral IAP repeat-containing protein 2-like n=1 Tax=Saccoglossus kowalevskii TaxID=10224 RepID=A0ABM0LWI8_SACKO|nr:PREDICTED: baculoviral IAP repeat-containing protein 2-like [Saccoglossus kowalevskii]